MNVTRESPSALGRQRSAVRQLRLLVVLGLAVWPTLAFAQLSRVGVSQGVLTLPATVRGTDVGYDPAAQVYLVVGANGAFRGTWTDATGAVVPGTSDFAIGSATGSPTFASFPRVRYSADVNNGQGGFLVTWHQNDGVPNAVHGAIVAYPTGQITPESVISDYQLGGTWWEAGPPIAYSTTSHRFLVAWQTLSGGVVQGRFVDTTGTPTGTVMTFESGCSRDPGLAWNAASNEFGLSTSAYCGGTSAGAFVGLRRIAASSGAMSARTTWGYTSGTFITDLTVNPATNHWVVAWSSGGPANYAELDQTGGLLGSGLIGVGTYDSVSLAFSSVSGTILTVGQGNSSEVLGVEMNGQGTPISGVTVLTNGGGTRGSFYPRITSRTGSAQWNISYSRQFVVATDQIVATSTALASTPPPPPPASTHPDMTVFRSGAWYTLQGSTNYTTDTVIGWGLPGDIPVRADFDGDGKPDLVVYRPSDGTWYMLFSSNNFSYTTWVGLQWGLPGDVPMAGDYDGDGKADLVVWRPSNGTWYARFSSTGYAATASLQWGLPGDIPVHADFDGDGRADLVVYRPSEGMWYALFSSNNYSYAAWQRYQWGLPGDIPVTGDFDGDGRTDLTVYRPSEGMWYTRFSPNNFSYANWRAIQWGLPGDVPLVGDFDGDGKSELVIWRPSNGTWYLLYSGNGYSYATWKSYAYGLPGDAPIIGGK